jgi:hypothetical protein
LIISLLMSMRFRKYFLISLGFWLVSSVSGCVLPSSAVKDIGTVGYSISPEAVLEKITTRQQGIITAIANIEVHHASERYSTKVAVLLKRPSSLRVEAIPVIGPVPLFLSIQEDVLKAFLPQKGLFYIGKATPENISNIIKFLPAALTTEDVVSIMLGTYPGKNENKLFLKGFEEGRLYRIDMMTEGRKVQSLWVDPSDDHLVKVQVFKEGDRILYTAGFEEFDKPGPSAIPLKISITSEEHDHQTVIIRYSSIQPATDVEETAFDLQMPPGTAPIHLD